MCSLFPVRCTGCGRPISCYYTSYRNEVVKRKTARGLDLKKVIYLTKENQDKTIEGELLDELNIKTDCCRLIFLTSVSK